MGDRSRNTDSRDLLQRREGLITDALHVLRDFHDALGHIETLQYLMSADIAKHVPNHLEDSVGRVDLHLRIIFAACKSRISDILYRGRYRQGLTVSTVEGTLPNALQAIVQHYRNQVAVLEGIVRNGPECLREVNIHEISQVLETAFGYAFKLRIMQIRRMQVRQRTSFRKSGQELQVSIIHRSGDFDALYIYVTIEFHHSLFQRAGLGQLYNTLIEIGISGNLVIVLCKDKRRTEQDKEGK